MINAILRVSPVDELPRVFCHCAAHFSDHHFSDQSNYQRRQSIFFSIAATTSVWNSLPEAVRASASLALFRKSLKTELFTRFYIG